MTAITPLPVRNIVLDCPDPGRLADFYRALLGWAYDEEDSDWDARLDGYSWRSLQAPDGGPRLSFQRDPDFQPSTWPGPGRPQMVHLDIGVTDLPAAHEHALTCGARLLSDSAKTFFVYADPAGHPFCLCAC